MAINSRYDKSVIVALCNEIEARIGRRVTTPRDFEHLSYLLDKSGGRVSPSTLKRIWGYNRDMSETYRPYRYTLVALASLLGYNDIEDFIESQSNDNSQSAEFVGETVLAADIVLGSIIELTWEPDRRCDLVALGDGVFKVVHAQRGHLMPGDIVRFMSVTQNAPLYFNQVFRPSADKSFVYTAGRQTVVSFRIRGVIADSNDTVIS